MDKARIQVLIPTLNCVDTLDATIESIREQDFDQDNIYITICDFGSQDGTYEKALSYDKHNFGVYRKNYQKNFRLMISEAARLLGFVMPGGEYSYTILLRPGEILYKNCLRTCSERFINCMDKNPTMLICECDIRMRDGQIRHQVPIYDSDRIIDGVRDFNDYVGRGYTHQIFEMGYPFGCGRYKANYENNEQRFWNKVARRNFERNVIYIKEPLMLSNEVYYENELEEIVYRWESIISICRFNFSNNSDEDNADFEKLAFKNLAMYALWRSYLLSRCNGDIKSMEDCFLIASVIYSDITKEDIYQKLQSLIMDKQDTNIEEIDEFFNRNYY